MTLCVGAFNSTSFRSSFTASQEAGKTQRDKNYSLMNLQPLSVVLPLKNTIFIMINENLCVSNQPRMRLEVALQKKRLSFIILLVSLTKFMMELFRIDCERVAVFWVGIARVIKIG